jgi:hypothetical protein
MNIFSPKPSTPNPPAQSAANVPGQPVPEIAALRQPTLFDEPEGVPEKAAPPKKPAVQEDPEHRKTRTIPIWNHGWPRLPSKAMEKEVASREEKFRRWPHEELGYLLSLMRSRTFDMNVVMPQVIKWLQGNEAGAQAAQRWSYIVAGEKGERAHDFKAKMFALKVRASATLVLAAAENGKPTRDATPDLFDNAAS